MEYIKRLILLSLVVVAVIIAFILFFTLRPVPLIDYLRLAMHMRSFLLAKSPFEIIIRPAWSSWIQQIFSRLPPSNQSVITLEWINVTTVYCKVIIQYENETPLEKKIPYSIIIIPSSGPLGIYGEARAFSERRSFVIEVTKNETRIKMIPVVNARQRGATVHIVLTLLRVQLGKLKERMRVSYLGTIKTSTFTRAYETTGRISVYVNDEYVGTWSAKSIKIDILYEVWRIA